ncbi:MAG: hypothetical protein J5J06_02140 [Phycisphaerae bacterium]|nr:hypothetical protein [Phycisphaerae bacterium]
MSFGKMCRCSLVSIAVLGLAAAGANAQRSATLDLVPVGVVGGNPPGTVIAGNDITIPAGGVTVEFEIIMSWSNSGLLLGTAGCKVDATTGFASGVGAPLTWLNQGIAGTGAGTQTEGAYQATQICLFSGRPGCPSPGTPASGQAACNAGDPGDGPCVGNPRFVLQEAAPLTAVAFLIPDYEFVVVSQSGGSTFGGTNEYMATTKFAVPVAAAGTYTIDFVKDPLSTYAADDNVLDIPYGPATGSFDFVSPGRIIIPTGACCDFSAGTCTENATSATCQSPKLFRAGETCADNNANGDPDVCEGCPNNAACDDADACTTDVCNIPQGATLGQCVNTVNFNTQTQCCDPATGAKTNPVDGDQCTLDTCSITPPGPNAGDGRGTASNPVNEGGSCDDGRGCFINDTCQADGSCAGEDINAIACSDDSQCPDPSSGCNLDTGFCECSEDTPLCVEFTPGTAPDPNCYEFGETVNATIHIGAGSEQVAGGQFLLDYDPACLDFQSIAPCDGSVFDNVVTVEVDEAAGRIFYAVSSAVPMPGSPIAFDTGPADMACLTFVKTADCDACDICLISENPRNTLLSNTDGNRVPLASCGCSKLVKGNGELTLTTPDGGSFNPDCNSTQYHTTWAAPVAEDFCDGPVAVDCVAEHDGGLPISQSTILNGGALPQGTTFFSCTATDSCGDSVTNVWTVAVSSQHALDVEVHLSPEMVAPTFERCINFDLYTDCSSTPETVCETITFGGPLNFDDHGKASLKITKENYACVAAQDILHTLRACATPTCDGSGPWELVYKGDPLLGGNWLQGGNLDAWKPGIGFSDANVINILDYVMLMSEIANDKSYPPNGSTACDLQTCTAAGPHGDINADGLVDAVDFSFVLDNFLANSKDCCCPAPTAGVDAPRTSITVKELRAMGLGDMASADLNSDGVIDMDDMALFMQGVDPTPVMDRGVKTRGTSR